MARSKKEKFRIRAGIMAIMGTTLATVYKLLWQNRPSPRFGKSFISPSLVIFFEITFKPEMHREFFNL
jgi:hypothetical protein